MINLSHYNHFHFLRPGWLWLLIPTAILVYYLWREHDPIAKWKKIIQPHLLTAMLVKRNRLSGLNPINIAVLSLFIAIISLAGPTWQQQATPFSEDIAGLVIAIDVTPSMQQEDIQPSRLERAKQKVSDLLALRTDGKTGLIVYAGTAHSVIPLTDDANVINNFLNAIDVKIMPKKGKTPEKALVLADKMLRDSDVPGTILLIGDGIGPDTKSQFNRYFSTHPYQLIVYGVGLDSAQKNDSQIVKNYIPLELSSLKDLAENAGGYYQPLTLNNKDVTRIIKRIDNYIAILEDENLPWLDAGYYLLFPLALLMLFPFRKGWALHWCVPIVMVFGLLPSNNVMAKDLTAVGQWRFIDLWLTADQQGRYYLDKGDYKTASQRFHNTAWKAVAYYRNEEFEAAAELFSRIDSAQGYFNLANAYAHAREYLKAVKSYEQVLLLEPNNTSALKNKKMIQDIIDESQGMSESQQAEQGEQSFELGEAPQTSEGAEQLDFEQEEQDQLSADDILLDEALNDLWMRQVHKDPSRFLSIKFQMQIENQAENADD